MGAFVFLGFQKKICGFAVPLFFVFRFFARGVETEQKQEEEKNRRRMSRLFSFSFLFFLGGSGLLLLS